MLTSEGITLWAANLDFWVKVVEWGGGALILLIVWWRTNSFHYLVHRIFQGLGATKTFHSETAQRQWNDYEDLQQHNLWHGLRLKNSRKMKDFLVWLDKHNVSIEEASRSKWCFNANTLGFSIPGLWKNLCIGLFFLIGIGLLFFYGVVLYNKEEALLKVKKSDTWFWVNSNQAHGFGARLGMDTWSLDNMSCLFTEKPPTELTEEDRQVVCQLVLGDEPKFIEDAIHSQKIISYACSVLNFAFCFWFLSLVVSIIYAKALYKRLEAQSVTDAVLLSNE